MKPHQKVFPAVLLCFLSIAFSSQVAAITIDTMPVGNAGNSADSSTGLGSVSYNYRIGTYEVTAGQYTAFLNSVAAVDTNNLYSPLLADSAFTSILGYAIVRNGSPGSYTYNVVGSSNYPIAYVSYFDAARFCNWMTNGQPGLNGPAVPQTASSTENGAYNFQNSNIFWDNPGTWHLLTRNPNATWFLPTHDEWYKAAFHKNDGVTNNYWTYATQSNLPPSSVAPPGTSASDPSNAANYYDVNNGHHAVNHPSGGLSEAGAYTSAVGPYGTFDQAGNLNEWTEGLASEGFPYALLLGGGWFSNGLSSASMFGDHPYYKLPNNGSGSPLYGFRVATAVPEPSGLMLAACAGIASAAVLYRRRLRSRS